MAAGVSCADKPRVKNVIYLIGDGMGLGAVSSAVLADDEPTGFEMNPVVGLSETASANNYVTDHEELRNPPHHRNPDVRPLILWTSFDFAAFLWFCARADCFFRPRARVGLLPDII